MRLASLNLWHSNWIELTFGIAVVCFLASCGELKRPEPNPYLAETQPPAKQEFRWSNGRLPKSLDPAFAAAAPETDVVRALYQRLTEIDARTLKAVPGVAEEWSVSEDEKTWTFTLRKDAKWSNGRPVTAEDFVRAWQRLSEIGERSAHRNLLDNFAKVAGTKEPARISGPQDYNVQGNAGTTNDPQTNAQPKPDMIAPLDSPPDVGSIFEHGPGGETQQAGNAISKLDVKAEGPFGLKVTLVRPDKEFAKVVAHPIFSPVFGDPKAETGQKLDPKLVTNGAFKISKISESGISLDKSETYWNRDTVKLDRVEFVAAAKPDDALEAYRTGKVDAVTNTEFAPLAQKVFSPYADFQKSTFAALNFYEVNYRKPPFNDRRIREALAISIERERLSDGELDGTIQPAFSFLPFANEKQTKIVPDKERGRELLEQAGFPSGAGFPVVRLVVNRNDTQQRVARAIAKMWKDNLNIETAIVVKEADEIPHVRAQLDYDVLRRGVVLPVSSEAASMAAIIGQGETASILTASTYAAANVNSNSTILPPKNNLDANSNKIASQPANDDVFMSVSDALFELHAIPLYFPTTFSLVKPYVVGFHTNTLDAPMLSEVSIDNSWQPHTR